MRSPHPPRWSVYAVLGGGLLLSATIALRSPTSHPAPTELIGFPLGPSTPFDPKVIVPTDARGAGAGTAFSVDSRGVWLTARHVVEGCSRVVVVTAPGRGVAARAKLDPASESALLFTAGGAPALPIAAAVELRRGALAFHPGFPKARAGEVASRLLRRETLVLPRRSEPVLAWVEIGHSAFLWGSLAGLSGAPALNAEGEVIAVTVAQAPRRHRVYTTTPAAMAAFLAAAGRLPTMQGPRPMSSEDYHATADRLRGRLSVAQVVCLD